MIGLIVTGHGHFASGLTSSLSLIAGRPKQFYEIDFIESMSTDDLEKKLDEAMDLLKDCNGILVLSDLAGGSPFKSAVICGVKRENVIVVAGTNLPMLIEISMARQFVEEVEDLTVMAINTGKEQIVRYQTIERNQEIEESDGI